MISERKYSLCRIGLSGQENAGPDSDYCEGFPRRRQMEEGAIDTPRALPSVSAARARRLFALENI